MSTTRNLLIVHRVFPAKSIPECLLLYKLRDKEMQYFDTDDGAQIQRLQNSIIVKNKTSHSVFS